MNKIEPISTEFYSAAVPKQMLANKINELIGIVNDQEKRLKKLEPRKYKNKRRGPIKLEIEEKKILGGDL